MSKISITLGAIAALALSLGPASALQPVLIDIALDTAGSHQVQRNCKAVIGGTTDLNQVTYVVRGQADGTSDHTVGTGTTVSCTIRNKQSKEAYGTVSMGLPGPHAEAVGTITAPTTVTLEMCSAASAQFLDGHTRSRNNC